MIFEGEALFEYGFMRMVNFFCLQKLRELWDEDLAFWDDMGVIVMDELI
jgi:hypothetical protein